MCEIKPGKVLVVTLTYEGDHLWQTILDFEPDRLPMEIEEGLMHIAALRENLTMTSRKMVEQAQINFARGEALDKDIAAGKVKPS